MPAELRRIETGPTFFSTDGVRGLETGIVGDVDDLARGVRPEQIDRRFQRRGIAVPEADLGAGLDDPLGGAEPKARGTTRDDGHLAFEIDLVHFRFPQAGRISGLTSSSSISVPSKSFG